MGFEILRERMVDQQIKKRGVRDIGIIKAMGELPREHYVPGNVKELSYSDGPLPISCGQTISQPYIVAYMLESLQLKATDKVLEIGTGSGYNAAVLAKIVDEVYTLEVHKELADKAKEIFQRDQLSNIVVRHGDGFNGWPEAGPFDAIILTAAPEKIPDSLLDQLAVGGRLIAPVGLDKQQLILVTKSEDRLDFRELLPVRFVPMV
jgi:protein-L-isoaspartate(D-aspartate) O-methyltransferase